MIIKISELKLMSGSQSSSSNNGKISNFMVYGRFFGSGPQFTTREAAEEYNNEVYSGKNTIVEMTIFVTCDAAKDTIKNP